MGRVNVRDGFKVKFGFGLMSSCPCLNTEKSLRGLSPINRSIQLCQQNSRIWRSALLNIFLDQIQDWAQQIRHVRRGWIAIAEVWAQKTCPFSCAKNPDFDNTQRRAEMPVKKDANANIFCFFSFF